MSFHRNAKLGLAGRHALVCAVESGMTLKEAAASFSVSPATAHRWWHRWLEAGEEARRTLSCLFDRSSRPQRSPRQLAPELEEAICACRRQTGWGPRLVAAATGFAHSTVWKVLRHRVTGDRRSQDRRHRDGIDFVHAIVDDHSRLAYAEIHLDERRDHGRSSAKRLPVSSQRLAPTDGSTGSSPGLRPEERFPVCEQGQEHAQ